MKYAIQVKQEDFELVKLLLNYIITDCAIIMKSEDDPIEVIFGIDNNKKESWANYRQYMEEHKLATFLNIYSCRTATELSEEKAQVAIGAIAKAKENDLRRLANKWYGTEEENENE